MKNLGSILRWVIMATLMSLVFVPLNAQEINSKRTVDIMSTMANDLTIIQYPDDGNRTMLMFQDKKYLLDRRALWFDNPNELIKFLEFVSKVAKGGESSTEINDYYPQSGNRLTVSKGKSGAYATIWMVDGIDYYFWLTPAQCKKMISKINKNKV